MSDFDPVKYKSMVKKYQDNDDPLGWFDSIYTDAKGQHENVFWADLEPSPYLLKWLQENPIHPDSKHAIAIGCGVGDDAEALSEAGYKVTAFDISPEAIKLCKQRYPNTKVHYLVADLFNTPKKWKQDFDLVYECNTIQVLPGKYRILARDSMVSLLSYNATILISCRSRKTGEQGDEIPLPLDKKEINGFVSSGLEEISFLSYDDKQSPSVPHFFASYKRVN